jgi:hypothetical protein
MKNKYSSLKTEIAVIIIMVIVSIFIINLDISKFSGPLCPQCNVKYRMKEIETGIEYTCPYCKDVIIEE